MKKKLVHVDVSTIVTKRNQEGKIEILLGERKKSRENKKGYRIWELPGGALEYGESFHQCGLRETKEETGLNVELIDKTPITYTVDIYKQKKAHEITFYFRAQYTNGKPKIKGKEKKFFNKWEWFTQEELPSKISTSLKNLIESGYDLFKDYEE